MARARIDCARKRLDRMCSTEMARSRSPHPSPHGRDRPVSVVGDCVGIWACKALRAEFLQVLQLGHCPCSICRLREAGSPTCM